MTEPQRLTSRHTPARVSDTSQSQLEVRMKHAQMIASGKDVLPKSYQNNPGAVMLAQEWAETRGVDLLTALQTVSFVHGKPVIDATMQRALAARAGYVVDVQVDEHCAVVTVRRGEQGGQASYSMRDAELAGLTGKDNWKKNPQDMLVARATSRAMRRFAPDVMVGVLSDSEVEDPADVGETVTSVSASAEPAPAQLVETEPDVVEAEIVEDRPLRESMLEVLAGLEKPELVALKSWVEAQGFPTDRMQLTEDQCEQVLVWVANLGEAS